MTQTLTQEDLQAIARAMAHPDVIYRQQYGGPTDFTPGQDVARGGDVLDYRIQDMGTISYQRLQIAGEGRRFGFFDARLSRSLTIVVESTLDADAIVQFFGAFRADESNVEQFFPIGTQKSLLKRSQIAGVLDFPASWFPYIGCAIQAVALPGAGNVKATGHTQYWRAE